MLHSALQQTYNPPYNITMEKTLLSIFHSAGAVFSGQNLQKEITRVTDDLSSISFKCKLLDGLSVCRMEGDWCWFWKHLKFFCGLFVFCCWSRKPWWSYENSWAFWRPNQVWFRSNLNWCWSFSVFNTVRDQVGMHRTPSVEKLHLSIKISRQFVLKQCSEDSLSEKCDSFHWYLGFLEFIMNFSPCGFANVCIVDP